MFVNSFRSKKFRVLTEPDKRFRTKELTLGIANGKESAFNVFYQTYSFNLYAFLLMLTRGNEEFARDCLQETMIRVIRFMKPFKNRRAFWKWLRRVARTTWIDEVRKRGKRSTESPFENRWEQEDPEEERLYRILDEVLESLPVDEKSMIVGKYFEKKSYAELALEQQNTVKAIESKLGRIRKKMRKMIMEGLHHEPEV